MSTAGTIIPDSEQSAETLARWLWCGVIFSLLGLQILMSSVAVFLSSSDPSNVIVEGYYEQALSWDQQRQTQADSDALGWKSAVTCGSPEGLQAVRKLQITLQDRAGLPVAECLVKGQLFHHARAGEVFQIRFTETGPGLYAAAIPMQRSGLWELSLVASNPTGTFQEKKKILVKAL